MTEQEQALYERMMTFEELYFKDLSLRYINDLPFSFACLDEDGRKTVESEPFTLEGLCSLKDWRLEITNMNCGGLCLGEEKVIRIASASLVDPDPVLCHEMIHGYVYLIDRVGRLRLDQWLCIHLYRALSLVLPELDRYLFYAAHGRRLILEHPLLFCLKALNLDVQLGYLPGTVFGYLEHKAILAMIKGGGIEHQTAQCLQSDEKGLFQGKNEGFR